METITYSRIDDLEVQQLDLFLPPGLKEGLVPALVHFHGGGMIAGCRKTLFFQTWLKGDARKLHHQPDGFWWRKEPHTDVNAQTRHWSTASSSSAQTIVSFTPPPPSTLLPMSRPSSPSSPPRTFQRLISQKV